MAKERKKTIGNFAQAARLSYIMTAKIDSPFPVVMSLMLKEA